MPEPLSYTKVCTLADFSHPELQEMLRDVYPYELDRFGPEFPHDAEYRKQWESAMSARALLASDVLGEDAEVLVVGAGTDAIVFWLTRHARRVHAVDDYLGPAGNTAMLADPSSQWPSTWNPRRLTVQNMRATSLTFEDASFDAVVLPNGFPGATDAYQVEVIMEEVYRVLRPGGVLAVATEFRVAGPRGAMPFPMFDEQDVMTHVVGRLDWEVLGAPDLEIDQATIDSAVSFTEVRRDVEERRPTWSSYPHLVLVEGESAWTSVHFALRKATQDASLLRGRRRREKSTGEPLTPPTIAADARAVDEDGRIVATRAPTRTLEPVGARATGGPTDGEAAPPGPPTSVTDVVPGAAITRAELEAEPGERGAAPEPGEPLRRTLVNGRGLATALGLGLVVGYPVAALVLGLAGTSGTPSERLASTVFMSVAFTLVFALVGGSWHIGPHGLRHHVHEVLQRLRLPGWLLLPAAALGAVVITQPIVTRLGARLLGDAGDAGVLLHLLEWQRQALGGGGSALEPNVFALTDAATVLWNPVISGLLAVYAPLRLVLEPVPAFNAVLVAGTFATLLAAYAFARTCAFNPAPAAVGALLYATTAQRLSQIVHIDTFMTFWIPLTALLLLRVVHHRRLVDGALLGGVLAASLVTAPLLALGCAIVTVVFLAAVGLRRASDLPLPSLAVAGGIAALAWVPFAVARIASDVPQAGDMVLPVGWADLLHPGRAYLMRWLAGGAEAAGGGASGEHWLFGSLALALLAAAGAYLYWRRVQDHVCPLPSEHPASLPTMLAVLAITGPVLAAGAYVSAGPVGVRLPLHALLEVPGLPIVRTSGPFMGIAFLPLMVLATLGYRRLTERQPLRRQAVLLLATALLVLATTARIPPATELDLAGEAADVNRALAERPPGTVLELPWPACPTIDCALTEPPRMLWSLEDRLPRVNGAARYSPEGFSVDPSPMDGFPDAASLAWLAEQDVRYVVVRRHAGPDGQAFTLRGAERVADEAEGMDGVAAVEKVGADYLITLER